jgi:hypothetical protein
MLVYQGSGGIAAPYKLLFSPTPVFQVQLQAYLNYLNALNPLITSISIEFQLFDAGITATPSPGNQIGSSHSATWMGTGPPTPPIDFFKELLDTNKWYRISTVISLNGGITFFPRKCVNNHVDVRIQVQKSRTGAVIQFRRANGRVIEKKLSLTGH